MSNIMAFPCVVPLNDVEYVNSGMNLRDWFAGHLAPALLTSGVKRSEVARLAYEGADALLAERKK